MTFFIVDGSKMGLRRMLMLLDNSSQFELVGFSADGNAAIASIRTVRPHVVILDLNLSSRNGMDVLKKIKQEMPSTIVLVITNSSGEQYRSRCTELGAEFFLDKSTEFSKLPLMMKTIAARFPERDPSIDYRT